MNNPNRRRYVITDGTISKDVVPTNDETLDYSWEREDGRMMYAKKLKTELKFRNDRKTGQMDFSFLYAYEQDPVLRCADFKMMIYKKCRGVEQLEFTGKFALTDCEWDLDRCTVIIKQEPDTIYQCIKENVDKEFNVLSVLTRMSTTANLAYSYEFDQCVAPVPGSFTCNYTGPNPGTFALFHTDTNFAWSPSLVTDCDVNSWSLRIRYREFVVVPCLGGLPNPPANGTGWLLEEDNCAGTGTDPLVPPGTCKYVRFPVAGDVVGFNPDVEYGFAHPTLGYLPPPRAVYQQVNVSTQPITPPIKGYGKAQTSAVVGSGSDWTFEVELNPNSTYSWSVVSGLPFTVTSGAGTNKITGFFGGSSSGSCTIQVDEVHGNGWHSSQTITVLLNPGFPDNNTVSDFITGPEKVCWNQDQIRYKIPDLPVSTDPGVIVTGPVWSVSAGATIVSGQGTTELIVKAGTVDFTVICDWNIQIAGTPSLTVTGNDAFFVTASKIPVTPMYEGVFSVYPSEPGIVYTAITRPGATYEWFVSGSSVGTGTTFSFVTPPTAPVCLRLKETVDCGCDFQRITDGGPFDMFPAVWWCPDMSTGITYNRGLFFRDVVEYVVGELGCDVNNIVSDFFEWNPIGDTPGYVPGTNYVTGLPNELLYLSLHEKSDVLDPTSSNPATREMMTFSMLEKTWKECFNCFWIIDNGGNLRIEHVSWFFNSVNYDSTASPHKERNDAKRKYTYDKIAMPRFEKFRFSESYYTDFVGAAIYYESPCVNREPKSNVEEHVLDFMTTDLYALYLFPTDASKDGWVLMCNDFDGVNYAVANEVGEISLQSVANGHLSWANLHHNYHRHERVLLEGYMNNTFTSFFTKRKPKLQKGIKLLICCGDFEPDRSYVKSELGDGIIKEAALSTKTGIIDLTLQHD